MELPVKFDTLPGWRQVYTSVVSHEELSERLLPDAMPDVARIVEVETQVFFEAQSASGRGSFSGHIRGDVLYQPEEGGLRAFSLSIPFQFGEEMSPLSEGDTLQARLVSSTGDARMLNPRKLLLRATLTLEVTGYHPEGITIKAVLPQEGSWGLEGKEIALSHRVIRGVPQKPFAFEDSLSLPSGQTAEQIVKCRPQCQVDEAKVVGSKLVVKGKVTLSFLLGTGEGELFRHQFDLPFSQILDSGGAGENAQTWAEVHLTNCTCQLVSGGTAVDVSFDLLAQGVLWETVERSLLSDVYSTRYPVEVEGETMIALTVLDQGVLRSACREQLECGVALARVQDLWATLGLPNQRSESGKRTLTTDVTIHACVLEEGGRVASLSRTYPVSVTLDADSDAQVKFFCQVEEVQGQVVSGGVEVRATVAFSYRVEGETPQDSVTLVRLEEHSPWSRENEPSLVLRRVEPGQSLWEIAKRFHTRGADILEANGLDGEPLEEGSFLLIPKTR
jgi:hypothetical protein